MTSKEALELLKGYKISDMYDSKIPFINKEGFFTMRECVETLEQDIDRLEKIENQAVGFIQFLINSISKRKLNDEQMKIMNFETDEEYGGLKDYITKKMKDIFNVDIKWHI